MLAEATLIKTKQHIDSLKQALEQVLFGQQQLIELVIIGMLSRGHMLLEGLPGLGKTELVKGLALACGLETKRVQFTPDLLPGDITGNPVLQERGGVREFVFQQGPLFSNLVLADEINRASPKTQSALLEAMQERQVTVIGTTHRLPDPFLVLATQNPIELEGTYPLPEAQLDRFLFKLTIKRTPTDVLEQIILNREIGISAPVTQVCDKAGILELIELARAVYLPPVVANYIARIVESAQADPGGKSCARWIKFGASPRAALALATAVKARALVYGRPNASFEDVQALATAVLRHRLVLDYNARIEGVDIDTLIAELIASVPVQAIQNPTTLQA